MAPAAFQVPVSQRKPFFCNVLKKRRYAPHWISENRAINDAGRDIHVVLQVDIKSNVQNPILGLRAVPIHDDEHIDVENPVDLFL